MATDPSTAQLGILTIARFAALAVLATEALFFWSRQRSAASPQLSGPSPQLPASSRFVWSFTPALLLAGLAFWCFVSVAQGDAAQAFAQLTP